jgi:hypothetical protein
MAHALGNKIWVVEHRSGAASEEADLTGGQWHSGEGRRCGGWRGFQGGPAWAAEDEGGFATTKMRQEALNEVAQRMGHLAAAWHGEQ